MINPLDRRDEVCWSDWLLAVIVGCLLAGGVWYPLLTGGGLVGGDTYSYFFPQKQVMAEAFHEGRIPLWHDRTALGYPLHAESQAAIFYPTNQILYRLFDINRAYSYSILLHYAAAFVLAWRFVRSQGVSSLAALFAGMIFVYGWFPARLSLEWSIVGGVWFPACLWMTVRWLEHSSVRRLMVLAGCFAIHMLAGHFTLAFITQLSCIAYSLLHVFLRHPAQELAGGEIRWSRFRMGRPAGILLAILISTGLAAVQLLPTIELKLASQRHGAGAVFNPAYGHLPPIYLTQIVASWWYWHTPEMAQTREMLKYPLFSIKADSNPVEAHLYFGLLPLLLLTASLVNERYRSQLSRQIRWTWWILSIAAVIYATGWLVAVFQHLPGFGFFMGPARYTIITTMGVSVLVAGGLDTFWRKKRISSRYILLIILFAITLLDLLMSSRFPIRDALTVASPPLNGLRDSWIREEIARLGPEHVRLLAPGPNVANLYGVSSVPQYLGLGPSEYFEDEIRYRRSPPESDDVFPSDEELVILRERGVTHILTTQRIRVPSHGVELVASGADAFLNRVWSRGNDSCFLYRVIDAPSRVALDDDRKPIQWKFIRKLPEDVEFEVDLANDSAVHLRELMVPGWKVYVDGAEARPGSVRGFLRSVDVPAGQHIVRWVYSPLSFHIGVGASMLCCSVVIGYLVMNGRGLGSRSA
ncbi:MAG: hypothetical protein JNL58_00550 [Planctomyces sp.]|nr:hypothetical protein [Planctomyces sp.]